MRLVSTGVVAASVMLAVGCASAPEPRERLAAAEASLRAAKEIGADEVPQAKLHAQLAREQVAEAHKLIEEGDNERAELVLRRANADAELAVAFAREARARRETEAAEAALSPQPAQPPDTMRATTAP